VCANYNVIRVVLCDINVPPKHRQEQNAKWDPKGVPFNPSEAEGVNGVWFLRPGSPNGCRTHF